MHMRGLTRKVLPVILLLVSMVAGKLASAQTDKIEGTWFNQKKDAKIQIYKATDGKFYGKIIWLKDPIEDGKPKMDKKNPKENLRSQPLVQMVIMKGFELD